MSDTEDTTTTEDSTTESDAPGTEEALKRYQDAQNAAMKHDHNPAVPGKNQQQRVEEIRERVSAAQEEEDDEYSVDDQPDPAMGVPQ